MKPYELLEHTADAKFRAYGATLAESFANAIKAMTAIVVNPAEVAEEKVLAISVAADDPKKLLYDVLSHVIFLMDTEHFLAARAEVTINGNKLHATLFGDDIKKHGGNIKAVTYSEMLVEESENGWTVQVVVDI